MDLPLQSCQRHVHKGNQLEDFLNEDLSSSDEEPQLDDEYNNWQREPWRKEVDDPIPYWIDNLAKWPRLACYALDRFGVPAMSAECERVF